MGAFAEACMAEYDENGWLDDTWTNPEDISAVGYTAKGKPKAAE